MPVIPVDKPLGLSSHDVVNRARRLRKTKRIGHTGTLDPLATGVLVLCVDDSTKIVQFMGADTKDYLAWISLGATSPTLDAEGPLSEVEPTHMPIEEQVHEILSEFVGPQAQVPPQYSAIQVGGQRAYAVARSGGLVDLPARNIVIHNLELLGIYTCLQKAPQTFSHEENGWLPDDGGRSFTLPKPLGNFPTLLLRARVGSGTYLRSLARDIGAALGVPAHLAGLVRTRVGQYDLVEATQLDQLEVVQGYSDMHALTFPHIEVSEELALELRQGKRPRYPAEGRYVVTLNGALVAVVDGDGTALKVVRAWT